VDFPFRIQTCVELAEPQVAAGCAVYDGAGPHSPHVHRRGQCDVLRPGFLQGEGEEICEDLTGHDVDGSHADLHICYYIWHQGRHRQAVAAQPGFQLPVMVIWLCRTLRIFLHLFGNVYECGLHEDIGR